MAEKKNKGKKKGSIFDRPKTVPTEVGVKDGFLPPEEHEESSGKFDLEMDTGKRDTDVYTEEGRDELLEDDEVSSIEQAWTEGAEGRGHKGVCAYCGKPLRQEEDKVFERKIDHELVWFCSEEHAKKGPKKKK